jgi:hypothetical protein
LIVLWFLTAIGAVVWAIALIFVLVAETYPEWMWRFLHRIVRREAQLFAYLASLVDPAAGIVVEAAPTVPSTGPST